MKFGILGRLTDNDASNGVLVRFINELVTRVERIFKNNISVVDNLNVKVIEVEVSRESELFITYQNNILSVRMLECTGYPIGWAKGALLSWQRASGGFNVFVSWTDEGIVKAKVKLLVEHL